MTHLSLVIPSSVLLYKCVYIYLKIYPHYVCLFPDYNFPKGSRGPLLVLEKPNF